MPRTAIRLSVEIDGRDPYDVTADQRDLAAREAADLPGGQFTGVRFLGWSASKRTGAYTGAWDEFNLADCLEVVSADRDDEDDEGPALDPGSPEANAAG